MYEELSFKIKGVAPLLMHNGQLADPLCPWCKAIKVITGKRSNKRTDADLEELARLEWYGGLYVEGDRPVIPGVNLEGMLREGGSKERLGKLFRAGVIADGNFPLEFDGPKTIDALWKDGQFRDTRRVGMNGKSIMKTRPIFRRWSLSFTVMFMPDVLNERQVHGALVTAGRTVGLCDFKPRFGRFEIV